MKSFLSGWSLAKASKPGGLKGADSPQKWKSVSSCEPANSWSSPSSRSRSEAVYSSATSLSSSKRRQRGEDRPQKPGNVSTGFDQSCASTHSVQSVNEKASVPGASAISCIWPTLMSLKSKTCPATDLISVPPASDCYALGSARAYKLRIDCGEMIPSPSTMSASEPRENSPSISEMEVSSFLKNEEVGGGAARNPAEAAVALCQESAKGTGPCNSPQGSATAGPGANRKQNSRQAKAAQQSSSDSFKTDMIVPLARNLKTSPQLSSDASQKDRTVLPLQREKACSQASSDSLKKDMKVPAVQTLKNSLRSGSSQKDPKAPLAQSVTISPQSNSDSCKNNVEVPLAQSVKTNSQSSSDSSKKEPRSPLSVNLKTSPQSSSASLQTDTTMAMAQSVKTSAQSSSASLKETLVPPVKRVKASSKSKSKKNEKVLGAKNVKTPPDLNLMSFPVDQQASILNYFIMHDSDDSGRVSMKELISEFNSMDPTLRKGSTDKATLDHIASSLGTNAEGEDNEFLEFLQAFYSATYKRAFTNPPVTSDKVSQLPNTDQTQEELPWESGLQEFLHAGMVPLVEDFVLDIGSILFEGALGLAYLERDNAFQECAYDTVHAEGPQPTHSLQQPHVDEIIDSTFTNIYLEALLDDDCANDMVHMEDPQPLNDLEQLNLDSTFSEIYLEALLEDV